MIWPEDISFDGLYKKVDEWYGEPGYRLGDPLIDAQYALDLIFKTLIDDKEQFPYLTAIPESTEQTNSIKLHIILKKYSRKYRKYCKLRNKERKI